jgi:CHAD domain-containing protein
MAYRIRPDDSVAKNVRRLMRRELDRALAAAASPDGRGAEEAIHEVRTRCKRMRGVLRLARPGLGDGYRTANRDVRDAARALSSLRDASALLATFDELIDATHGERLPGEGVDRVRAGLARRAARARGVDAAATLSEVGARLARVRRDVSDWAPKDDAGILLDGLAANHRRGRRAFRRARSRPDDATLHDWRKRAKYGWHHTRLLAPLAPSVLGPMAKRLKDLSDALGDDHDLAVLRATITANPDEFGGAGMDEVIALIDVTRADLLDRCLRLGARTYAEPPSALRARVAAYWAAWEEFGRERPVGEIAELAHEPADRPTAARNVLTGATGS